jgi:ATP/maltotriose-dependent transcriptional regulator MalT
VAIPLVFNFHHLFADIARRRDEKTTESEIRFIHPYIRVYVDGM